MIGLLFKALKWLLILFAIGLFFSLPGLLWGRFVDPTGSKVAGFLNLAFFVGLLAYGIRKQFFSGRRSGTGAPISGSHGTARWGEGRELVGTDGFLIGRRELGQRGASLTLRYAGPGHLLTLAPTRSGKGVSAVIPNLLDYTGSVFVTDIKGENYAVTADRRRALGHQVHALDPFSVVGGDAAFNPLDLIDADSMDAVDDAMRLADMLVVVDKYDNDPHFNDEARSLLQGLILHVAATAPPSKRNLAYVRELVTLQPERFATLLDEMGASDMVEGLVARAAARHRQKSDREASGVVSSAQRHTAFLDSPRMARALSRSTFDLADLKREALSIYLVLPADRLSQYRRWLRLLVSAALQSMSTTAGRPSKRVLFLLDEFSALGKMDPVLQAFALLGGYGAAFWIFAQDLSQLRGRYGDEYATFLSNSDVLQAFGTSDHFTAKLLSDMTGDATIYVEGHSMNAGRSQGDFDVTGTGSQGTGHNISEKGRKLLFPDEVRRLDPNRQILFIKGADPLLTKRINYLHDPEFKGLYQENPMHRPTA